MRTIVAELTLEEVADRTEAGDGFPAAAPGRGAATEADKIRRQQQLRRKTKLARRALTARRVR